MSNKNNWNDLSHVEKIDLLKNKTDDELIQSHRPSNISVEEFRKIIAADRAFWRPNNLKSVEFVDEVPTKETTIGARRDLNRAEAILELIDNSIDAWLRRRAKYKKQTAAKLLIYIDRNEATRTLTFEDNAGGVETAKLVNLVIPGHSDTEPTEPTIGSYRTGGKKAIFKLASGAIIRTRYWNPVGTSEDEAVEIHLDESWLNSSTEYEFPYYVLQDKTVLQRGQTIYNFRLRDDIAEWDSDVIEQIRLEIRRTYSLLILRHPEIEIYFLNREEPLTPLEDLYKFTAVGLRDERPKKKQMNQVDLLPERVIFNAQVEAEGTSHKVDIEVILGCRTTVAPRKGDDIWGIDLYGNDRLFVHHDQENFIEWFNLPKGTSRQFIRGLINIQGPNTLIPWDTHKRHLNVDQPIVNILKKHKLIRDFFEQWKHAYNALAASEEIKRTIAKALPPWNEQKNDLNIPHDYKKKIDLPTGRRKGLSLPTDLHKPTVPVHISNSKSVDIKITVSKTEFIRLCADFDVTGAPDDRNTKTELAETIKDYLLGG